MTLSHFRRFLGSILMGSALSLSVLGLSSCGGGGGGSDDVVIVAPESLEGVRITCFNSFELECYRQNGVAGNESGACRYDMLRSPFRIAINTGGGENIGTDIAIPAVLTDVKYTYVRTSPTTGTITLTYVNQQVYPFAPASNENKQVVGVGEMFWSTTNLVIDLLFTDAGGVIGNTTGRFRSATGFYSYWTGGEDGFATTSTYPIEFDSTLVQFSMMTTGAGVATGYNPYLTMTPSTPNSSVWTTWQGRTVDFTAAVGNSLRVAYQSSGGTGPSIPGYDAPEETGTVLVDSPAEGLFGVGGTFSYMRTGGSNAKFALSYPNGVGTTTVVYNLFFDNLEGGTYTDSAGGNGVFREDLYKPQP